MCALTKMPEYYKKYNTKEIAAAISVCEDMEYNLAQCMQIRKSLAPAFITCFLYIILIATIFAVSFAMATCWKIYALYFRPAEEDAYHD
jgi:nitrogen fixation/metabolism regulation signal transduction histidine kinase